MKLTALDTLHVSSAGPDNILAGEQFEVSDEQGKALVSRGLASEVAGDQPEAKAEPAPKNKVERAPKNKTIGTLSAKAD
jgi:hypothetical protein